jgi:POT family proton-dependent oligopeptide transporter
VSTTEAAATSKPQGVLARVKDFFAAFRDLLRLPRAFWAVNLFFMIEAMGYFGVLTLMDVYLPRDVGVSDWGAGLIIAFFTGLVTLFMLGIGAIAERLGVRRGLLLAVLLCVLGRLAYAAVPLLGIGHALAVLLILAALLVTALGEGMIQPVSYAGIKYYTDHKTSSMGYGLIYALMNLGIFVIGYISPLIRVPVDDIREARAAGTTTQPSMWGFFADWGISGVNAVNWVCTGITVLAGVFLLVFFTRRAEAQRVRVEEAKLVPEDAHAENALWYARVGRYFSEGPFSNARFVFFIFMLLPVQTLFAHQWLTMPAYVLRAYPQGVADRMEWIVNWINPGIIFFGVPVITAITRRVNVYTLMIVGSAVSALPTLLLALGPHTPILIVYLVLFSIGEALWSPRFLQYAAELAPEGRVSQYMGLANVPWLAAKFTTGLYSGYMLGRYCPEGGVQHTQTMWFIYSLIALASPIGLLLGRRWVMRGSLGEAARPKA